MQAPVGFWDPAGPPAPFNRDLVCIPEVSDRVWVSQCIPRVYHTCCKAVSFTLQFLVFCTAMLCACDSCSFTTEDHIRCFVNLFCCIRTSDDFTKFVAWYSLYVALLWSLRIAGICLVGICDHCVIKHPTYPVRCTFVGQVRHRQNRYFIQRRKRESRRCSIQRIVKLAALMIYVSLWSHFLVTPKVSVRRNMVHVHALTYIVHATFRILHRLFHYLHAITVRTWKVSRRFRNKLQHALNGNMYGQGKSNKGRGKHNKGIQYADEQQQFSDAIMAAMPIAARNRMHPRLLAEEWTAPVVIFTELSSKGGVSIVYKADIPSVLQKVGYTQNATAMVTTQSAQQLGLRAYPCDSITCTLAIQDNDETKHVTVQRFLIQLGFGPKVCKAAIGELVSLTNTMCKVVLRMPPGFGWTPDMVNGPW